GSSVADVFCSAGGASYNSKKLDIYKEFAKGRLKACEELANKMHATEDLKEKKQIEIKLKQEIKDTNREIYKHYVIAVDGCENNLVKILAGGVFMGIQIDEEYCIEARTSAILFLAESEVENHVPTACINCKKCAGVCPVSIQPMQINNYAEIKNFEECKKLNVMSCIECGACSYVCPAKIPLAYNMKMVKKSVKNLAKIKNNFL
ncbi:MAG: 4Fe-4S dicluster domain-containing protein, partial [Clostridia bacterium]|nr:4Fe-4S dicluster domain-containing protein [Clostridia bacterium]